MKVTRLGPPRPLMSLVGVLASGSSGPSGQVPTANGSNGVAWGSNVAIITSNGSNALLGPFVNFASGAGIAFAAASNTLTISATGGGTGSGDFPLGLAAPDKIPASPGAEDQEFEGTADTLPTDFSWLAEPASWSLNSTMPSWWIWERAASNTTEYKARIANFAMAATSGLWVKMGNGVHNSASSQWEWIIYDSSSSNGYGAGVHNGNTWVARDSNAGTLANRGTVTAEALKGDHAVIGVIRVSDTWTTYVSRDGIHFQCIQTADTRAFTVARLEFRWSADAGGGAYLSRAGVDWIRYRTDNLFPKP